MLFLILLIIVVYGILILWFADGLQHHDKKEEQLNIDAMPLVSVIVSARNEEKNIPQLISALNQQSYPHHLYEILVANDRSSDGTAKLLQKLAHHQSNLTVETIKETPLGWSPKKWALSQIIERARGEILIQTDADCIPTSKWIETIVQEFDDPSVGFVSGPAPLTNHKGYIDNLFEMESLAQDVFSAGALSHGFALSCTGRNIAFRKSAYEEISGYEDIQNFQSGDDDLLLQKVATQTKWKVKFSLEKNSIVESPPPKSIVQFVRQRLRFASKGLSYYQMQSSTGLKLILPFLYLANFVVVISLLNFAQLASFLWLVPLLLKAIFDGVITYIFYSRLKLNWSLSVFAVLTLLHPFYVVIFGALGPFTTINWKR